MVVFIEVSRNIGLFRILGLSWVFINIKEIGRYIVVMGNKEVREIKGEVKGEKK